MRATCAGAHDTIRADRNYLFGCHLYFTPAELLTRLRDIGIELTPRALKDWRENGMLPPLRQIGLGRGDGSKKVWDEDPLEQAIAAYWLLDRRPRAKDAVLDLWFAGYNVDPLAAQAAWVDRVEHRIRIRNRTADLYENRFLAVGKRWWKELTQTPRLPVDIRELFIDGVEWVYDENERDDEALRQGIAELVAPLFAERGRGLEVATKVVEFFWNEIEPTKLFAAGPSIEFIGSFSVSELNKSHHVLRLLRQTFRHVVDVHGIHDANRIWQVGGPVLFMQLFGPLIARLFVLMDRKHPSWPLRETIELLHDLAIRVEAGDPIIQNGNAVFSQRISDEWAIAKDRISLLWSREFEGV
jgi:hypothetical protein